MHRISNNPIGIFDSGLGGLTVVKEAIKQLPNENIIYYGDTARVPYGTKSKDSIISFSKDNARVLLKNKVKIIVVACNSSSSYALNVLKRNFKVPIIGVIEPGVKAALDSTKKNRVGIIATSATIASGKYEKLLKHFNKRIKVFSNPCPLFVPLVEEGWLNKKITKDVAKEYLKPLMKNRIDTLVLGCTHYPLLKPILQEVVGNKMFLIDSASEVVREVKKLLGKNNLKNKSAQKVSHKFIVSDKPQKFQEIAKTFMGYKIKNVIKG